jgi:hypothetical protein
MPSGRHVPPAEAARLAAEVTIGTEKVALVHLRVLKMAHLVQGGSFGLVVHQAGHASFLGEEAALGLCRLLAMVKVKRLLVAASPRFPFFSRSTHPAPSPHGPSLCPHDLHLRLDAIALLGNRNLLEMVT